MIDSGREYLVLVWRTWWAVVSGGIAGVLGVVKDVFSWEVVPLPSWLLLTAAALALLWAQFRAFDAKRSELLRATSQATLPDMRLDGVIDRIVGAATPEQIVAKENEHQVMGLLAVLRERAGLGTLSVWGRLNEREVGLGQPLTPIASNYWHHHSIDILAVVGSTSDQTIGTSGHIYGDLHFSRSQIERPFDWRSAIEADIKRMPKRTLFG